MDGHEPERPPEWVEQSGHLYCLACRRELAAEQALVGAPLDATAKRRAELKSAAIVEFEVKRDPERPDGEIARSVRTSVAVVQRARERLVSPPSAPS
jgi:hypothetical protein